jgi:peptide/nickel transport system substrate-binding protein
LAGATAAAMLPLLGTGAKADDAPKHGGRFRMALAGSSTTDTFEPGQIWDTGIQNISAQVRDLMTEVSPEGKLVPALAESWEPSKDATTWSFKLRKGVEFHNGKSFTSQDVLFTMNHHLKPDSISGAKGVLANVADVKADGPNGVIYTLKKPDADFGYTLSDYHMVIMQDGTTDWNTCIGTSAYVLKEFKPGSRFFATKNPNYWRNDRGWFDEVETLIVNDTAARMNALLSGQVDCVSRVDLKTVNLLKRNSKFTIQNIEGTKQATLPMLCDVAPFNDPNVRLGLKWALNRKHIVDQIFNGYAVVGNDQPIAKINRYFNPDLPQREYDADKAKFYLKKAGQENTTFQLHVADAAFAGAVDTATLYQEDARQAGVNIEIVREPADGYWKNVWINKPWCASFWSGRPTEDAIFTLCYGKDSNSNESHWDNPKFNDLLVAARGELDDAKRRQMYYEMQQICSDDSGSILPVFLNIVQATTDKVGTNRVSGYGEMDMDRAAHNWWFKA